MASNGSMIRIWGMLSEDDENAGFDLRLDANWQVLLLYNDSVVASFDPRDYTLPELEKEVRELINKTGVKGIS